jgi:hypothetical protein
MSKEVEEVSNRIEERKGTNFYFAPSKIKAMKIAFPGDSLSKK